MKKKLIFVGVILLLLCLGFAIIKKREVNISKNNEKEEIKVLYSWNREDILKKKYHLFEVIKERKITCLYHEFSSSFLASDDSTIISELKDLGVDTYYLTGAPEMAFDNGKLIKERIDDVINFNNNNKNKIKGIVLDIEPYKGMAEDEVFTETMLTSYYEAIKNGSEYAKKNNIKYVVVIPTWYNKVNEDILSDIISCADRIEVMNYVIKNTIKNIKEEIRYAKLQEIEIGTLYEVDFNSKETGEDEVFKSYYEMDQDFIKMQREYDYDKLYMGYHYFGKM